MVETENYRITLNLIQQEMNQELLRLLKYWEKEVVGVDSEGYIGQIDHFGNKNQEAPKGIILGTRILWTFSAAYRFFKNERFKIIADKIFLYLIKYFWNLEYEGFIWTIDHHNKPLNSRKQIYGQAQGIYALSEYYRSTGNKESLEYAIQLYHIIENKSKDFKYGGFIEALAKDWGKIEDMRLSKKDMNSPKSMNTHLHILEAYSNLYRVWPNKPLKQSMISLIGIFKEKIINKNTGHFNLFFDMNWKVRSSAVSFGHDIEGAWLLHEAAILLRDPKRINTIQKMSVNLVNITLKEGTDADGSIFNERDGDTLDRDKHWWQQAEAMIGVLDAFDISSKNKYLEHFDHLWNYIKNNIIDKENGEWYWRVNNNREPIISEDKVGLWKCPYHNCRALMEGIERINKIIVL